MVADTIGVNRSTARSVVARYIREGRISERPRGGAINVCVDNEMKDCLNDVLNDNCMLTLAHINQVLRQRLPRKPRIHDRTVARTLDGMLFRFKIARHQPAERNSPDVIQKRHDYANWFMGQDIAQKFADFFPQTRLHLDPDLQFVFIYDGAPAHHNPDNPGANTQLKKLPHYSPFLNIVEQAISSLKAAIKADISLPEIQREMNNRDEARRQGIPLGHYQTQLTVCQRKVHCSW